jgi:hypothetical protein
MNVRELIDWAEERLLSYTAAARAYPADATVVERSKRAGLESRAVRLRCALAHAAEGRDGPLRSLYDEWESEP